MYSGVARRSLARTRDHNLDSHACPGNKTQDHSLFSRQKEAKAVEDPLDELILFTTNGWRKENQMRPAAGGPGVEKTTGTVCETVKKYVEQKRPCLVLTPTRVARRQLSACLLPICNELQCVAEVCGHSDLSPLEQNTRQARVNALAQKLQMQHDQANEELRQF